MVRVSPGKNKKWSYAVFRFLWGLVGYIFGYILCRQAPGLSSGSAKGPPHRTPFNVIETRAIAVRTLLIVPG